ncbi:MAG: hypothetical protein ACP5K9_01210 [Candidatus Micrarchaeia archaeon]
MQGAGADKSARAGFSQSQKMVIYLALTLFLLLAAVEISIAPRGSPLHQCNSIIVTANRYLCLSRLALSTDNASICSYMPGLYSAACLTSVAKSTGNQLYCRDAMAINQTLGSMCIEYVANETNNPSLCYAATPQYAQSCAFQLAIKLNNSTICGSLGNSTLSEECTSAIGIDEAVVLANPASCGSVANTTNKSIVNSVMSNLYYVNMSKYPNLQDMLMYSIAMPGESYSLRDICYAVLSTASGNYSYCSYASPSGAGMCRSLKSYNSKPQQMNYTSELAACNSLGMEQAACREAVMLSEAIATKNVSICYSFGNNTQISNSCIAALARQYLNESYCKLIKNSSASEACAIALHSNSSTVT